MIGSLPAFRSDGSVNVVVESPRGSRLKLKFSAEHEVFELSRPLPAGLVYPHDWGFIPSTTAADGDPIDALVAWDGTGYPGLVIPCRPIGALKVEQTNLVTRERETNDRVIMLPVKAPTFEGVRAVFDLPARWRQEIEQFFTAVVVFEGKDIGLCGWTGADEALTLIRASVCPPESRAD